MSTQHVNSILSRGHRCRQTGITKCLNTLKSDPCQPPGRPGCQSWHVDRQHAQWRHGWSSIGRHLEGHRRRSDDPCHVHMLYCVVRAEGHDDPRPARGILFPRHHLVSKSLQQGVALTGRNTTGPLCAAPW